MVIDGMIYYNLLQKILRTSNFDSNNKSLLNQIFMLILTPVIVLKLKEIAIKSCCFADCKFFN